MFDVQIQKKLLNMADDKSYKCDFCALKLENFHLLCQHLQQIHNISFIQCEYCSLEFPSKSELSKHVKSRHTVEGNPRVECSICPGTFLTLKGLIRHMNQVHTPEEKIFPCKKCNKKYKNKSSLINHVKLQHQGKLIYVKCSKCPKLFYGKQTLRIHKNVEHKEDFKRVQCHLCTSSYKYKSHLRKHIREKHFTKYIGPTVKNVSTEFKCDLCCGHFVSKAALLEHRKTVHNRMIEIFSCDHCSAVFKLREAFEHHLWEEHGVHENLTELSRDKEDYVFQDFVDFEYTMLRDYELRQLIKIRQARKFSQKFIIVSYTQQPDPDPLVVEESEVKTIQHNIKLFFKSLINQYPSDQTEKNNDPSTNSSATDNEENDSEMEFPELDMTEQDSAVEYNKQNLQLEEEAFSDTVSRSEEETIMSDTINNILDETLQPAIQESCAAMKILKIMFNCMECTELFPDEDALWKHLTTIHKKIIKRPQSKEQLEISTQNEGNNTEIANLLKERISRFPSDHDDEVPKKSAKIKKADNKSTKYKRTENKTKKCKSLKTRGALRSTERQLRSNKIVRNVLSNKYRKVNKNIKNSQLKPALQSHEKLAHKCTACSKTFIFKAHLVRHNKYAHKNSKTPSESKKEEQVKSLQGGNDRTDKGFSSLMFPCEHCQALFPCVELLSNHLSWQHNN